jgi:hypothetical protein
VYASAAYIHTYMMYVPYVPAVRWTATLVFNDIYVLTETVPYINRRYALGMRCTNFLLK